MSCEQDCYQLSYYLFIPHGERERWGGRERWAIFSMTVKLYIFYTNNERNAPNGDFLSFIDFWAEKKS